MIRKVTRVTLLALGTALLCASTVPAQEPMPAPPPPDEAAAAEKAPAAADAPAPASVTPAAPTESDATAEGTEEEAAETVLVRDPFWPVGYTPPKPKDPEKERVQEVEDKMAEADWRAARRKLELVAITKRGQRHYAYLREYGLVEEGNVITVRDESFIYKFRIGTINQRGFATQQLEVRPLR